MFKKIWSSFTSVKGLIIINSVLTILGLFQNITTQAYCVPSLWAALAVAKLNANAISIILFLIFFLLNSLS
jgi:hypothetical protein